MYMLIMQGSVVVYRGVLLVFLGCPSIVRSDRGTEKTLASSHMALRHNHHDEFQGVKSFRFGPSTTNTVSHKSTTICFVLSMLVRVI